MFFQVWINVFIRGETVKNYGKNLNLKQEDLLVTEVRYCVNFFYPLLYLIGQLSGQKTDIIIMDVYYEHEKSIIVHSQVTDEGIAVCKEYFLDDLTEADWKLTYELKTMIDKAREMKDEEGSSNESDEEPAVDKNNVTGNTKIDNGQGHVQSIINFIVLVILSAVFALLAYPFYWFITII